ncbi:MAG: hypothetical protein MK297_00785 [Planctomycetes bacterium]|nr:hypothetical protein [Planctomycetota bacterium]
MTTQENIERPATLSVGILLSVATSALALFCIFGGATFLGVIGGVTMVEEGVDPLGLGIVYSLGCFVVGLFTLFQLLTLYAGWRAWEMDKTWIWVLVVLSALSMLNSGMLTMISGVVTIVGCVQALERLKTA